MSDVLDPYVFGDEDENEERHGHHRPTDRHKSHGADRNKAHNDNGKTGAAAKGDERDEEEEEEEEEIDGLFIAFPFTTQMYQPEAYRGSDPEWKDYIVFSKNRELQRDLRGELYVFSQRRRKFLTLPRKHSEDCHQETWCG